MAEPTFKFDSQSCFLTYAQSTLTIEQVYTFLNGIKPVHWARVCLESHATGGTHIHAVARWNARVQSRNPRFLDCQGFHPNIQSIRSIKRALDYVSKDGEFIDYGPVPAGSAKDENWVELASKSSRADFMSTAFAAGLSQNWAREFWDLGSGKQTAEIRESYEATLSWESEFLQNLSLPENKCAVLIGPTGCGKSSWAKRVCPKPALWVSHMDVLRMFRPDYHQSIIFDDMAFHHLPLQSQIHLVDWIDCRQIHCRYGYATIPAKTVKIFTCNERPFVDHPAIERRVLYVVL